MVEKSNIILAPLVIYQSNQHRLSRMRQSFLIEIFHCLSKRFMDILDNKFLVGRNFLHRNKKMKERLVMSGPSLKKVDAHSSIHEAALNEARELRELYRHCLVKDKKDKALQVAEITIEHWETRTLKHAESEEEGMYKEMVDENPELHEVVIELTRDHNLMRNVVEQMKEFLGKKKVGEEFISFIDALIIIDEIHNEDEMNKLLGSNK